MTEKKIPKEPCLDKTLALLQEGYLFIPNRLKKYHSDVFETRLLGKRVICISGSEAAKLFYKEELFKRKGALPKRVQKTLFGVNAIQSMDGKKHLHRKKFFMSLLSLEYEEQLAGIVREKWKEAAARWEKGGQIVLFDEANLVLCQAVCEWAGVPLESQGTMRKTGEPLESQGTVRRTGEPLMPKGAAGKTGNPLVPQEAADKAKDFAAMVSNFAAVGLNYQKGKMARKRTEKWIQGVIEDTRAGRLKPEKDSVLYRMAGYKENGKLLNSRMAAIELINVLRPIIAVSRFIVFAATGMFENPAYKEKWLSGENDFAEMFAQEVRRYYPFAPCLGAVVKQNFKWNGYPFREKTLVLLDLYGTNHDPRIWKNPDEFRPERFQEKKGGMFGFIPQGGGNPAKGHRCPGEGVTTAIMKASLDFLIRDITFELPPQNLNYDLGKIPAMPESGFVMSNVQRS